MLKMIYKSLRSQLTSTQNKYKQSYIKETFLQDRKSHLIIMTEYCYDSTISKFRSQPSQFLSNLESSVREQIGFPTRILITHEDTFSLSRLSLHLPSRKHPSRILVIIYHRREIRSAGNLGLSDSLQ